MISVLTTMMTIKQGKQSKGFEKGNYKCIRMDAHAIKSSDTPKWWDHSQTSKKYSKRSQSNIKGSPGKGVLFKKNSNSWKRRMFVSCILLQSMQGMHICIPFKYIVIIKLDDIAYNSDQYDHMKHVEVDKNILELSNIRSEDQLAYILTEVVTNHVFG